MISELYINKFVDSDKTCKLPKNKTFRMTEREMENQKSIIVVKELKSVIQTSYKETSGSDVFYQLFKKENRP